MPTWLPDQDRIRNLFVIVLSQITASKTSTPSFLKQPFRPCQKCVFFWGGEWLCRAFLPHTNFDISSSFVLLEGNEEIIQLSLLWSSSTWTVKGQSGKHKLSPLCCKEWSTPRAGWTTDTGEGNPPPATREPGKSSLRRKEGRNLKIKFQTIPQATNLFQFLSGKPKAQLNWSQSPQGLFLWTGLGPIMT